MMLFLTACVSPKSGTRGLTAGDATPDEPGLTDAAGDERFSSDAATPSPDAPPSDVAQTVGAGADGGADAGAPDGPPPAGCSPTQHRCAGSCVDSDSVDHCGALCERCPAPAGATPSCNGTTCDFTCGGGQQKCVAARLCVPAGGCCASSDCPPQPGGQTGTCDSGTHLCNYDCPAKTQACTAGGTTACIPAGGCCRDSDCPGACQACSAGHTCVPATGRDDPNGRCAGTCDATGACRSKRG